MFAKVPKDNKRFQKFEPCIYPNTNSNDITLLLVAIQLYVYILGMITSWGSVLGEYFHRLNAKLQVKDIIQALTFEILHPKLYYIVAQGPYRAPQC